MDQVSRKLRARLLYYYLRDKFHTRKVDGGPVIVRAAALTKLLDLTELELVTHIHRIALEIPGDRYKIRWLNLQLVVNEVDAVAVRAGDVRLVFDTWRHLFQITRGILSSRRQAAIDARLREGYTVAELQHAVFGLGKSKWHAGENPDGKKYTDLLHALGSPERVDRCIQTAKEWKARNEKAQRQAHGPDWFKKILEG